MQEGAAGIAQHSAAKHSTPQHSVSTCSLGTMSQHKPTWVEKTVKTMIVMGQQLFEEDPANLTLKHTPQHCCTKHWCCEALTYTAGWSVSMCRRPASYPNAIHAHSQRQSFQQTAR
jgi:hypothetical protein